ncbi:MAG: phosphatase PAP2 family protein [Candidatus Pacearchaeota archaeon]|nr:phosphatase PAP2 family protein [Candidatus Pacearchaeota archaeon]
MLSIIADWDFVVAKAINNFAKGSFIDSISWFISYRAFVIGLIAFIALIILWKDKKYGKYFFIAFMIAICLHGLFNEVLWEKALANKIWYREPPHLAYPNEIVQIGHPNRETSFPSDHMSFLTLSLVIICYYYRKRWVWLTSLFAIILMGLSRIHNGMHYPTDVLGGIITGAIYAIIGIKTSNLFMRDKTAC